MPASNSDPLAAALSNTFKKVSGASKTVDEKMESNLQKSLLVPVQFDDPVRHTPSAPKSSYIMLANKPQEQQSSPPGQQQSIGQQNNCKGSNKQIEQSNMDQVPSAKLTLFRREQVQIGHLKMGPPGSGMWNMGNTCYLNSTLQALFHIPAFSNYLRSGGHDTECSLSGFSSCTICILASTLRQTLGNNVIKPVKLYEKLKFICKHLVHGRQEDAHEFLRYLIESLQKCYLISRKVPKTMDNYSKETTPFNQIFGGYMRQELHCLKCHHVSTTFQHFMDLLLDIRNADNIDTAVSGYFKKEMLSQEDMYKCEHCKQKVPAYKIYKIERPPLVLCIQLKRFNMMGGKNGRPVTLSKFLDISKYVRWASSNSVNFRYRLVSLITHVGPSPNCGHYTAIGEAPNGTYYRFDDVSVNPTSVQNVLNTSAYVIFYEMSSASRDSYLQPTPSKQIQSAGPSKQAVIGPQLPSPIREAKVSTSYPSNPLKPGTPVLVVKPQVQPKMISEPSKPRPENKLGVVINPAPNKSSQLSGLVPYGGGDSSSEDELTVKPPITANQSKPVLPEKATKSMVVSPFLPRAVAAQIKRNKEPESLEPGQTQSRVKLEDLSIYEEKDLSEVKSNGFQVRDSEDRLKGGEEEKLQRSRSGPCARPGSSLEGRPSSSLEGRPRSSLEARPNSRLSPLGNNVERSDSTESSSQERLGFTVSDKEAHNPSIHSDNSTGSTHSFTVTDLRGGAACASSTSGSTPRVGWNVTPVHKRDRSQLREEESSTEGCEADQMSSPVKRAKLQTEKPKKSMLDEVKNKTTETLREFGKDVLSAGAKFRQQLGIRSNKVTDKMTDKLMKIGRNVEEIVSPRAEESSTSCQPSTSMGSSKVPESESASDSEDGERRKKKSKKKKKKKKKKERSRTDSESGDEWEEKTKDNLIKYEKSSRKPHEKTGFQKGEPEKSGSGDRRRSPERTSGWNPDVPVTKWDHRPDIKQIGRSVTWDGSRGSNFVEEIKKKASIRSWSGDRSGYDVTEGRKRSAESDDEMDRGRTKKVKKRKEERNLDYNPFQVVQNIKNRGGPSYSRGYDRDPYSSKSRDYSKHRESKSGHDHSRHRHREDEGRHDRRSWDHNYNREHGPSGDRSHQRWQRNY